MRRAFANITVIALLGCASAAASSTIDPRVEAVVERTRTTTASYSVFARHKNSFEGGKVIEGWVAEFHAGDRHRMESANDRIVADCSDETGSHLSVLTGDVSRSSSFARISCGIHSNRELLTGEWLGRHDSKFGPVDRIRVTDWQFVRTYDVSENGAIVFSRFEAKDGDSTGETRAVELVHSTPEGIFSEDSLGMSAVPNRFKSDHSSDE